MSINSSYPVDDLFLLPDGSWCWCFDFSQLLDFYDSNVDFVRVTANTGLWFSVTCNLDDTS